MTFDVNFSALFLAILTAFSSCPAGAESATPRFGGANVAVFTPWSFFQKSLQKALVAQSSARKNLGDLDLTFAGLNWHLTNVQAGFEADFEQGNLSPDSYEIQSKRLKLKLTVDKLSLDQIVEQVVSGVLIRVRVQAECAPLVLLQESAQVQARIGFQLGADDLSVHLENFDLRWPEQSWQLAPFTCQGAGGLTQALQTGLQSQLSSAESLRPILQGMVAKNLQGLVGEALTKLKTPVTLPQEPGLTPLTLRFKEFQSVNGGVLNWGTIVWSGKPDESSIRPLSLKELPAGLAPDAPVLLAGAEAWSDLIRAQVDARPIWAQIDLRQQSFFMRVLNSRFLQFFVWPDLWNYSKSSPFALSVAKPTDLQIKWNADGSANIALTSLAWVQSSRDHRSWNYVRLDAKAAGRLTPSIKDGKIFLHADVKSSGLTARFGEDYVKAFHSHSWLAASLLEDFFNKMGQNLDAKIDLPSLDLGPLGAARADGWQPLNSGLVGVPLRIVP